MSCSFVGVFGVDWWRKELVTTAPVVTMYFRTAPDNEAEILFVAQTPSGERLLRYSTTPKEATLGHELFKLLPPEYSDEEVHLVTFDLGADLAQDQDELLGIDEIRVTGKGLLLDEIRTIE